MQYIPQLIRREPVETCLTTRIMCTITHKDTRYMNSEARLRACVRARQTEGGVEGGHPRRYPGGKVGMHASLCANDNIECRSYRDRQRNRYLGYQFPVRNSQTIRHLTKQQTQDHRPTESPSAQHKRHPARHYNSRAQQRHISCTPDEDPPDSGIHGYLKGSPRHCGTGTCPPQQLF